MTSVCSYLPPAINFGKEKRESKLDKSETAEFTETISSLMDLGLVSGVVDGQGTVKSRGKRVTKEKRKKKAASPARSTKSSGGKPSTDVKLSKSSAHSKIEALNQKWSDKFNRLEAQLLSRNLESPQQQKLETDLSDSESSTNDFSSSWCCQVD